MGLFKSEEEKQQEEEKKITRLMTKYHLENIDRDYAQQVREIAQYMVGVDILEAGNTLGTTLKPDIITSRRLGAIMQQNWIMIRLLDDISKKLDK